MPEERTYWVYILTNGRYGSFYVGVTNSLERRIAAHKGREVPGFTRTYRDMMAAPPLRPDLQAALAGAEAGGESWG